MKQSVQTSDVFMEIVLESDSLKTSEVLLKLAQTHAPRRVFLTGDGSESIGGESDAAHPRNDRQVQTSDVFMEIV